MRVTVFDGRIMRRSEPANVSHILHGLTASLE